MFKLKRVGMPTVSAMAASRACRRGEPVCEIVVDGATYGVCERCAGTGVLWDLGDVYECEACSVVRIDAQREVLRREERDLFAYYATFAKGPEPR